MERNVSFLGNNKNNIGQKWKNDQRADQMGPSDKGIARICGIQMSRVAIRRIICWGIGGIIGHIWHMYNNLAKFMPLKGKKNKGKYFYN